MQLEGVPVRNDYKRALVTCTVGRVHLLVRVRLHWVQMCGKKHRQVGPGTDFLHGRGCEHKCFGANTWEWARTGATGHELEVRMCGTGRGHVESGLDSWNHAQIPCAHKAAGTNIGSKREQKVNQAQPLRSRHVSGHGQV